jgi:hypothetical protein
MTLFQEYHRLPASAAKYYKGKKKGKAFSLLKA